MTEVFTELLPARVGHNLMHHRIGDGRHEAGLHRTGADCPCNPTQIPHDKEEATR